jgi:hypothetical protein
MKYVVKEINYGLQDAFDRRKAVHAFVPPVHARDDQGEYQKLNYLLLVEDEGAGHGRRRGSSGVRAGRSGGG